MKRVPPLMFLSGSEGFLRRRFLQQTEQKAAERGWRVERVDGTNRKELAAAMGGASHLFMQGNTLVVAETTGDIDEDIVNEQKVSPRSNLSLLVYMPAAPKKKTAFSRLVTKHPKYHKEFTAPKPWKAEEEAASFCVGEAARHNKKLNDRLAGDLVRRIGVDLGHLSFEIQKYAFLADSEGADQIEPTHIKRSMAALSDASAFLLSDALEKRSRRAVLYAVQKIKTTQPNSLIEVLRRTSSPVFDWLRAANMVERKIAPTDAAALLGVNEWRYRNYLLPAAGRWRTEGISQLIELMANTERSVLNGCIDPWVHFESGLLRIFDPQEVSVGL